MNTPFDYMKHGLPAVKTLFGVESYLRQCGLEKSLLHLVKLRASQINGCAYCVDLHVEEALADGEHPTRLHVLSVWHETSIFSEREQAALAWTERVTLIAEGAPDQALLDRALAQFTETELVNLNLAVAAINAWNRFGKTFHARPALKSFKQAAAG